MCSTEFYGILSPYKEPKKRSRECESIAESPQKSLSVQFEEAHDDAARSPLKSQEVGIQKTAESIEESSGDDEPLQKKSKKSAQHPPLTQVLNEEESSTKSDDDNMEENEDRVGGQATAGHLPPKIEDFLSKLGEKKAKVIHCLHWLAMTALIGSVNLYVEVAEHKIRDQQIKSAMEEAMMERKADKVTFKLAQERSADKPVLEGIVEKTGNKLKAHERRLQSLEDRANNDIKKKNQHQASSSKKSDTNKQQLKDRRGAQGGAASKKKSHRSNNNNNTSRSNRPPPKSARGSESAGGSKGGTARDSPRRRQPNKKQSSKKKTGASQTKSKTKRGGSNRK